MAVIHTVGNCHIGGLGIPSARWTTIANGHERAVRPAGPKVLELQEIAHGAELVFPHGQAGAGQHVGLTHQFTARQQCCDPGLAVVCS